MHRAALICTSSRFISTFPRSESNPRFRFSHGVPSDYHPDRIHTSARAGHEIIPHPGLPPLGKGSNVQDDCPRPALSSTQIVLQPPIIPSGVRASSRNPSPERPIGLSFAEPPALSSLWPIALATPYSSPRPAMYATGGLCGRAMHRVPTSAEPETIGLEEIGGSTGAGSERTKIFAV
jgi:hypothetical protein